MLGRILALAFSAALLVCALVGVPGEPPAAALELATNDRPEVPSRAAGPAEVVRTMTHAGRTVTVRMHPVSTRSPGFEVLRQQADGGLVEVAAPAQRSYLGSVDGLSGALAAGIIRSDGRVEGIVVFDRGATWHFIDGEVVSTRGVEPFSGYHWPSASDTALNVTVRPGQVGSVTYRWDVGYDLTNQWFVDPGSINGSVARALDAVELNTVFLLAAYEVDARLRPATGRVVIRGSAAAEPYAGYDDLLVKVREEWKSNQADANVDAAVLWRPGGGGVAYVGTISDAWSVSSNGGTGAPWVVTRHEVGHNWGAHDNHTNGPEGPTIESGNAYHRFDGTELSAIVRLRDDRLGRSVPPLIRVATLAEPVPPYAALDLVRSQVSGVGFSFRPTANDHDANGGTLSLRGTLAVSHLGGRLTRDGDVVTYTPPRVSAPSVDWVRYVVRDPSGRAASGISMFQVAPYAAPGRVGAWPLAPVLPAQDYRLQNTQSGLYAVRNSRGALAQGSGATSVAGFAITRTDGGFKIRHRVSGRCAASYSTSGVRLETCAKVRRQVFQLRRHPTAGTAVVAAATGRCIAPVHRSIRAGAGLVQMTCGLSLAVSWQLRSSPVSSWRPASVATSGVLRREGTTRFASVPAGVTGASTLLLRSQPGADARLAFASGGGTWRITASATNRCFDAYVDGPPVWIGRGLVPYRLPVTPRRLRSCP